MVAKKGSRQMRLFTVLWNTVRRAIGFGCRREVSSVDINEEPAYQGKNCDEWIALLINGTSRVRADAVLALAEIGPASIPALTELLRGNNTGVRTFAILALGRIGLDTQAALPALTESLRDENTEVRLFTAMILGRIGPKAKPVIPALMELLRDEDEQVRKTAAKALERIK